MHTVSAMNVLIFAQFICFHFLKMSRTNEKPHQHICLGHTWSAGGSLQLGELMTQTPVNNKSELNKRFLD